MPAPVAACVQALPVRRLAEPFEELRERSDACVARHGERPKALTLGLGHGRQDGDYHLAHGPLGADPIVEEPDSHTHVVELFDELARSCVNTRSNSTGMT